MFDMLLKQAGLEPAKLRAQAEGVALQFTQMQEDTRECLLLARENNEILRAVYKSQTGNDWPAAPKL